MRSAARCRSVSRSCARWSTSSTASRRRSARWTAWARRTAAASRPPRRAGALGGGGGGGGAASGNGRRGRPRGSGTRGKQALELVRANPGITIPELAEQMGIQQNYLYRVLPGLQKEGMVRKEGRGWHPMDAA